MSVALIQSSRTLLPAFHRRWTIVFSIQPERRRENLGPPFCDAAACASGHRLSAGADRRRLFCLSWRSGGRPLCRAPLASFLGFCIDLARSRAPKRDFYFLLLRSGIFGRVCRGRFQLLAPLAAFSVSVGWLRGDFFSGWAPLAPHLRSTRQDSD